VRALLEDHATGRLPSSDGGDLGALLAERHPDRLGLNGWRAINTHELQAGKDQGRPRAKLTRRSELFAVARHG
jgi:ferredoxin--NADP+ reductase